MHGSKEVFGVNSRTRESKANAQGRAMSDALEMMGSSGIGAEHSKRQKERLA